MSLFAHSTKYEGSAKNSDERLFSVSVSRMVSADDAAASDEAVHIQLLSQQTWSSGRRLLLCGPAPVPMSRQKSFHSPSARHDIVGRAVANSQSDTGRADRIRIALNGFQFGTTTRHLICLSPPSVGRVGTM